MLTWASSSFLCRIRVHLYLNSNFRVIRARLTKRDFHNCVDRRRKRSSRSNRSSTRNGSACQEKLSETIIINSCCYYWNVSWTDILLRSKWQGTSPLYNRLFLVLCNVASPVTASRGRGHKGHNIQIEFPPPPPTIDWSAGIWKFESSWMHSRPPFRPIGIDINCIRCHERICGHWLEDPIQRGNNVRMGLINDRHFARPCLRQWTGANRDLSGGLWAHSELLPFPSVLESFYVWQDSNLIYSIPRVHSNWFSNQIALLVHSAYYPPPLTLWSNHILVELHHNHHRPMHSTGGYL